MQGNELNKVYVSASLEQIPEMGATPKKCTGEFGLSGFFEKFAEEGFA
jgi:hypothetical protein